MKKAKKTKTRKTVVRRNRTTLSQRLSIVESYAGAWSELARHVKAISNDHEAAAQRGLKIANNIAEAARSGILSDLKITEDTLAALRHQMTELCSDLHAQMSSLRTAAKVMGLQDRDVRRF